MYAEVLVEYTNKAVDKKFTYLIPNKLMDKLKVGMKVLVPFNNRDIHGFVVNIKNDYSDTYELKKISDIEDEYLILNDEMLELGKYLQELTLCSKIVAYQTMLPSSLKVKEQKHNYDKYDCYVKIKNKDLALEYILGNKRSKAKINILNDLLNKDKELKNNYSRSVLKDLIELDLVLEEKVQTYRINYDGVMDDVLPTLSIDQENAIKAVDLNRHDTYLLHGITGSGKTEVYMRLISKVLEVGKTACFLVPEISLTTQMIDRLYKRFGASVAILHSGLSNGEKYDEYLKIYRGETSIVVGTRSAIFAPLKNLGIIILDEEHSETFKQDTNPRYSALDIAIYRGKYNNCPVILGSATPTLESMARAKKNVYKLISMPNRIGTAVLPSIRIVDMVLEMRKRNNIISEELKNKILDRLEKKEQTILLLNRRGHSTVITCSSCGYTYKCPNCDITLTYHKTSNNLRCHYCGYTVLKDKLCPNCHEESLNYLGLGTEKLELELQKMFNNARIVRMDVDTTSRKGAHEQIIKDFKDYKYDILLGTQMISKGLDFPKVTLVGVINADTTLNIPDFRSGERTYELLSQVAGRAGRSGLTGEVILQTFDVDNTYLNYVKESNYEAFYLYEMNFRRKLKYPPYYYLVSILVTSKEYELCSLEATKVFNYLKNNLDKTTLLYGPTTASVFRINSIYRFQIMVKYRFDDKLKGTLKYLDEMYAVNNKVNIEIDINPSRM